MLTCNKTNYFYPISQSEALMEFREIMGLYVIPTYNDRPVLRRVVSSISIDIHDQVENNNISIYLIRDTVRTSIMGFEYDLRISIKIDKPLRFINEIESYRIVNKPKATINAIMRFAEEEDIEIFRGLAKRITTFIVPSVQNILCFSIDNKRMKVNHDGFIKLVT